MGTNPQVKAHAILDLKPRGHQLQIEPTRYSIRETHFARHCKPPAYSSRWCARTPPQTACSSRQPPFHPRLTPPLAQRSNKKKGGTPPDLPDSVPRVPPTVMSPRDGLGSNGRGCTRPSPNPRAWEADVVPCVRSLAALGGILQPTACLPTSALGTASWPCAG